MCRLIFGCPVPSSRATAEKLPVSTTRAKLCMSMNLSMEGTSTSYLFYFRINVMPIRQTYLTRRGGGHCLPRISTFATDGGAGEPFATRLRRIDEEAR